MGFRDLGLSYEQAAHGVQSAVALKEARNDPILTPKHMRVGIDLSKSDQAGLAQLLMDKGLITLEEYLEYVRLAANDELSREEEQFGFIFR